MILEIFAGHLSDRIKYFVSQNEILLVLTDRPALFMKTAFGYRFLCGADTAAYPFDGRADKWRYWHNCCADNQCH